MHHDTASAQSWVQLRVRVVACTAVDDPPPKGSEPTPPGSTSPETATELRKWYRHGPPRFDEFTRSYQVELTDPERAAALAPTRGPAVLTKLALS